MKCFSRSQLASPSCFIHFQQYGWLKVFETSSNIHMFKNPNSSWDLTCRNMIIYSTNWYGYFSKETLVVIPKFTIHLLTFLQHVGVAWLCLLDLQTIQTKLYSIIHSIHWFSHYNTNFVLCQTINVKHLLKMISFSSTLHSSKWLKHLCYSSESSCVIL